MAMQKHAQTFIAKINGRLSGFARRHGMLAAAIAIIAGIALAFPIFYFGTLAASCLQSPSFCASKYSGALGASEHYWSYEAAPFSIVAHRYGGSVLEVAINNTAGKEITMTGFAAGNDGYGGMKKRFAPGQLLEMEFIDMGNCTPNTAYNLNVTITYDSADGVAGVQAGKKSIIGICN
jgi:hypothetical protein